MGPLIETSDCVRSVVSTALCVGAAYNMVTMRILLLNLDIGSAEEVKQALAGQGYEITTGRSLTVDEILGLSPEVLITEATPSDLSCCGLISQIKAGPVLRTLKIVMIVHGGALERARALDLGADDVISFPFEPVEFAARIRTQFRERQPEVELEAKLNDALKKEHLAESCRGRAEWRHGCQASLLADPGLLVLSAAVVLAVLGTIVSQPAQAEGHASTPGGGGAAERRHRATSGTTAPRRSRRVRLWPQAKRRKLARL